MKSVIVIKNLDALYDYLVNFWSQLSSEIIEERGSFNMALSGGRTPYPFYSKLALQKSDWQRINVFMVDERVVPLNSNESNFHNIERALLNKVDIPENNIFPINTNLHSFELSIEDYNRELNYFFKHSNGGEVGFDFILLGLGTDGHTASLFPGTKALTERYSLAAAGYAPKAPVERITMTYPLINSSENILFLITGGNKREIVKKLLVERDETLPAAGISSDKGRIYYLIDKDAAADLELDSLDPDQFEIVQ